MKISLITMFALVLVGLLGVMCANPTTDQGASGTAPPTVEAIRSAGGGVPSFIQKDQTYSFDHRAGFREITVIAILDDGWIQGEQRGDRGWFHITSGTFIR